MSALLTIRVDSEPLVRLEADLAVAGVFSDERPLRGGGGCVDWRLCGLVSELLARGHFSGAAGEALLLPSQGRLAAPRVLVLGLGPRADYPQAEVENVAYAVFRRGLDLGARTLALAPLGLAAEEVPQHAEALVGGPLRALREAGVGATLRLAVPEDALWATTRALTAVAVSSRVAAEVSVVDAEASPETVPTRGVAAAPHALGDARLGGTG